MAIRTVSLLALITAMHVSSAFGCSIDALKKIAEDHLDRLPASAEHEFVNHDWSSEGGSWQMFGGESGTPHSIVMKLLGETGQRRLRTSFLNRKDFVIVDTDIDYAGNIADKDWKGDFKVKPPQYYFFCDAKLQIQSNAANSSKFVEEANNWKKLIFEEADMLKSALERIPEK